MIVPTVKTVLASLDECERQYNSKLYFGVDICGLDSKNKFIIGTDDEDQKESLRKFLEEYNITFPCIGTTFSKLREYFGEADQARSENPSVVGAAAPASHSGNSFSGKVRTAMHSGGVIGYAIEYGHPFSLAISNDPGMNHQSPVARNLKSLAGDKYGAEIEATLLEAKGDKAFAIPPVGTCHTTTSFEFRAKTNGHCQHIHNVIPEPDREKNVNDFATKLKNSLASLLREGKKLKGQTIVCSLIGCGGLGSNGTELAEALYKAYQEYRYLRDLPEIILVGWKEPDTPNPQDQKTIKEFKTKWRELTSSPAYSQPASKHPDMRASRRNPLESHEEPEASTTRYDAPSASYMVGCSYASGAKGTMRVNPASTRTSSHTAGASASQGATGGSSRTFKLGSGQTITLAMHSGGALGYAKEHFIDKSKRYGLVNPVNSGMLHEGGLAKEIAEKAGNEFVEKTRHQVEYVEEIEAGQCFTTKPYRYEGESNGFCQHIYNVVPPFKGSPEYREKFIQMFVSLLEDASKKGSEHLVCGFAGCGNFGGLGSDLADAVYYAYRHLKRNNHGNEIPKLTLVGWSDSPSDADQNIHDDFNRFFRLKRQYFG